ncbi:hypothetical protein FRX54_04195 [Streptococcus sp. sy004]|nr:hypothetical protein FRX54_04195 [Streptococcus sp. sy004]
MKTMFTQEKLQKYLPLALIGLVSLGLILPQWLGQDVILGSDSIFHYNRFYDAAMQIKNGNISYFISIYGFQQSGRIVNALYGPFFAYFQGLLVLISKNWFGYQLLSRFVLHLFAGLSMFSLLRAAKIRLPISLSLAIFYLTTFSVQYWSIRQGFSSWGAALMPYCLIPIIQLIFEQKVNSVRMALAVALMLQVHVLSALFLVLIYIPFYLYSFVKSSDKLGLIWQTFLAVVLAIFLTLNIWAALIFLRQDNKLLDPFINPLMQQNTIDGTATYWLNRPIFLLVLFIIHIFLTLLYWRKTTGWEKVAFVTYLGFLLLSTSFFPWQYLLDRGVKFAELIQFPFRFFIPATVLLLLLIGRLLNNLTKSTKLLTLALSIGLVFSMLQVSQFALKKVASADKGQYILKNSKHVYLFEDYQATRSSLFDSDKSKLLQAVQKATPDYLPIYDDLTGKNTYVLYAHQLILPNVSIEKTLVNNQLTLTWSSRQDQLEALPVVKYERTKLFLNGKELSKGDYQLSELGAVTVQAKKGLNQLMVTYQEPKLFTISLWLTIGIWLMTLVFLYFPFIKLTSKG